MLSCTLYHIKHNHDGDQRQQQHATETLTRPLSDQPAGKVRSLRKVVAVQSLQLCLPCMLPSHHQSLLAPSEIFHGASSSPKVRIYCQLKLRWWRLLQRGASCCRPCHHSAEAPTGCSRPGAQATQLSLLLHRLRVPHNPPRCEEWCL